MSYRKEQKDETKAKPDHNDKSSTPPERKRAAEEQASLVPSTASIQQQQRQEIREAIVSAFDEAKENTQKTVKEAKRDIPHFTQVVSDYHEQTLETSRELVENYIDSQKEIINSLLSTWISQTGSQYDTFWSNMMSPNRMTETYVKMVSRLAENTITATKLSNNIFIANMEAFKTSMQQARDNVKEISRLAVSNAKTFEQIVAGEYVKSSNQLKQELPQKERAKKT
jgi:ElaB/YqjD/DUF883 family membrane-anchored ribosome-binding protein